LELFLFLGGLNHIVSLSVLTRGIDFTSAGGVLLDETFIFDTEVLNATLAELEFDSDLVTLFLSSLEFRE